MLKTLLVPVIIILGLTQNRNLGTYYEVTTPERGKTQELTLFKPDSFCYKVPGIGMELRGKYRVSYDSLILATGTKLPIIFQIKHNKLVAFNGHSEPPEWYLTKVR